MTTDAGKRILLVDDQSEVRAAVRMLLDLDQHTVTEAREGLEALRLYEPGRFDLLITDYAMPRMCGDDLAATVRQLAPAQPILMITGSAQSHTGFGRAADVILNKPFTIDELRRAIVKACSRCAPPSGLAA